MSNDTVNLRVRTPEGVVTGVYQTADVRSLEDYESTTKALRALEIGICASGLVVNPFDVSEAVVSCNGNTYRYEAKEHE